MESQNLVLEANPVDKLLCIGGGEIKLNNWPAMNKKEKWKGKKKIGKQGGNFPNYQPNPN